MTDEEILYQGNKNDIKEELKKYTIKSISVDYVMNVITICIQEEK